MKKIKLYYFSGTGNTKYISHLLKKHLNTEEDSCTVSSIEYYIKNKIKPNVQYDMIGIGYPVYSFNAAKIMMDFIKTMPEGNDKKVFIYQTAGADSGLNYAAGIDVKKGLTDRGYEVISEYIFEMPSNFMTTQNDKQLKEMFRKTNREVKLAAEWLLSGIPHHLKHGPLTALVQKLGKLEQFGDHRIGKKFHVTDDCNNCGICLRNCPRDNIFKKKGKITFDKDCMLCFRCIYNCPENAISTGKVVKWAILKEGYQLKDKFPKIKE